MSFSSMHNDYLDPDRAGLNEDWGPALKAVEDELKKHDTGRWAWNKILCSFTGKDADLEPWGRQGIGLLSVDSDGVTVSVHGGKTLVGLDVCLNIPRGTSPEEHDRMRDQFLDHAYEIVCGTASEGEWDGDSWYMSFSGTVKVPWEELEDGSPDYEKTVVAVIVAATEALVPWEREMMSADQALSMLAGWTNADGSRCQEGSPGRCAAWIDPYEEGGDEAE